MLDLIAVSQVIIKESGGDTQPWYLQSCLPVTSHASYLLIPCQKPQKCVSSQFLNTEDQSVTVFCPFLNSWLWSTLKFIQSCSSLYPQKTLNELSEDLIFSPTRLLQVSRISILSVGHFLMISHATWTKSQFLLVFRISSEY